MPSPRKDRPRLAVWKFSSCDGCQLTLLNCEDQLLELTDYVEICYFAEASSDLQPGPYDVSLVEGSIATPGDEQRIREIREQSEILIAIGACATAGGVQALRNTAAIDDVVAAVYPHPEHISILATSTAIADHVQVDGELRGCPIDQDQLIELVAALLASRPARIPTTSVCTECKANGHPCIMVTANTPCLGSVTQAGCRALCPRFDRGCYGCFGPMESPNTRALADHFSNGGLGEEAITRLFQTFNAASPPFALEAERQLIGQHRAGQSRKADA